MAAKSQLEDILLWKPAGPRKEDTLFQNTAGSRNNASVNVSSDRNQFGYTEGYRRAAQVLVEYITTHVGEKDLFVYPLFFLYRHHIELALKNILLRAPYVMGRSHTDDEEKHLLRHELEVLWKDVKPMFNAVCEAAGWEKLSASDEAGVDSYIDQLSYVDPGSYSFRYTHTAKGNPSLPQELKRIDLKNFAEMMERLAEYLGGVDRAVSILEERKAEMECEWRSDTAQNMGHCR